MQNRTADHPCRTTIPWNRGKLIGPKPPLKAKEIWFIRVKLQVAHRIRGLALFNLALDSKLRACDLVAFRIGDAVFNRRVRSRATIMQRKTGRPVQFETTEQTREAVGRWLEKKDLHKGEPLFPSRVNRKAHHDAPVRPPAGILAPCHRPRSPLDLPLFVIHGLCNFPGLLAASLKLDRIM